MKSLPPRILGLLMITLALVAVPKAIQLVQPQAIAVDFPCSSDYDVRQEGLDAQTRIAYCLSYWPFEYNGGWIYAVGTSEQDETKVKGFRFRRKGEMLYVNWHPVSRGEMYKTTQYSLTRNPWIMYTHRFEIGNNGLLAVDAAAPPSVLFITGNVRKGWMVNPLGLLLLGGGAWLLLAKFDLREG